MNREDPRILGAPASIRVATPGDTDAVSLLLETSYPRLLAANYDKTMLDLALPKMVKANPALLASGTYYVAEAEGGLLVGGGGWTVAKPGSSEMVEGEAHIRHFAVHPAWTRRGIGRSLLARCISDARLTGTRRLYCFSTLNAETFYQASGFRTIGPIEVPMGPAILFPAVLMEMDIG